MNLRGVNAGSSASGVAVDADAAENRHRTKCAKHGLFYDQRKASGCRKCLERGRKMADTFERKRLGFQLLDFGEDAAKRAFVGLAVALVVGLIPASYHAFRVGAASMHRLRNEQEQVSRKAATEETLQQFQILDDAVAKTHTRAMRTTGLIWVLVSGGALLGWFRVTA